LKLETDIFNKMAYIKFIFYNKTVFMQKYFLKFLNFKPRKSYTETFWIWEALVDWAFYKLVSYNKYVLNNKKLKKLKINY